jgi:membrane protein YqaA with SNARE-associated domain
MEAWMTTLLQTLSLPEYGLGTAFVVAFLSATLLPLGSEPVVFGLVKLNPELFWPAIGVATLGNTLGGMVSWAMGRGAQALIDREGGHAIHLRALDWLERFGPKACLLAWLPLLGDPLCLVAGWLKFPPLACAGYMAIGKFLRYLTLTWGLLWAAEGVRLPAWLLQAVG